MIIYTGFQKKKKMAEIQEENVVAKLQCVGYKSYIDEICETTTSSLLNGKKYRLTMIIEKTND